MQENENLSAHLAAEKAKLTEVIPEWKDEKVRDKEAPEMATYLRGIGKTAEEINAFNNSTAANFKIVRDAMKYAQLMEKVGAAKSKARTYFHTYGLLGLYGNWLGGSFPIPKHKMLYVELVVH